MCTTHWFNDAGGLGARRHVGLARGRAPGELGLDGVRYTLPLPALGEGDVTGKRDIDQLEGGRYEVKVVGYPLDGILGDVVSKKGPARQRAVNLPEDLMNGMGFPLVASLAATNLSK